MSAQTYSHLQKVLFIWVVSGVTLLTAWVLWPFALSIFWAGVLAIVLYPTVTKVTKSVRSRTLATVLVMLCAVLGIGIPLYIVGTQTATEGVRLYQTATLETTGFSEILSNSDIRAVLTFFDLSPENVVTLLQEGVQQIGAIAAREALSLGAATANFVLKFGVMAYLLFFLLKDGARFVAYLERIIPLGDERERFLFSRFSSTIRAVVKGTIVVSIAQGAVGALLFFGAGIGSPVLWGVLMALCAMIPAVGPALIWMPAGILLLAVGHLWQGLLVLVGGALIVGTLDNILRPALVGRDTEMPDAIVLLSILGGIATFGISGVIIGPVVCALFVATWNLFGKDFQN